MSQTLHGSAIYAAPLTPKTTSIDMAYMAYMECLGKGPLLDNLPTPMDQWGVSTQDIQHLAPAPTSEKKVDGWGGCQWGGLTLPSFQMWLRSSQGKIPDREPDLVVK